MSQHPRGAQDFSSPQIRVRGANDFRHYSRERLRLPNERPPIWPRIQRFVGVILTLALLAGIGVGVYFGVTLLLEDDDTAATEVVEEEAEGASAETTTEVAETTQTETAATAAAQDEAAEDAEPDPPAVAAQQQEATAAVDDEQAAVQPEQAEQEASPAGAVQAEASEPLSVSVSSIVPTVSEAAVTTAQINGAEIVAERVTGEPIPSGIPRELADGAAYDPTEPATVFTSRWPIGTTLRLTRLPGATLLSDEEQAEVVGAEALVVVRGTESSNTDLQLSPAAFDRIAFYGTERIIAVRVEVTAPPP